MGVETGALALARIAYGAIDVFARIEIEYQPIRLTELGHARSPRMQLGDTPLHETDQCGERIGRKIHRSAAAFRHFDARDRRVHAVVRMLLVKALALPAVG